MGIFALFLFFSQVDFAIIRLLADLLVTGYSTVWFIQNKRVVPASPAYGSDNEHLMTDHHKSQYDDDDDVGDAVMLDLHLEDRSRFSIYDIEEEPAAEEAAAGRAAASRIPASDDAILHEDAMMLPLSLSSTDEHQKTKKKKKMHARLPSQTTVTQRNEDTRP